MKRFTILLALICLLTPNTASAQMANGIESGGGADLILYSLSLTGVGLVAMGLSAAVSTTVGVTAVKQVKQHKKRAMIFIKENATTLAQDVSLGGGRALTDLANIAGVEPGDHKAFARMARKRRGALVPLFSNVSNHEVCVERLFAMALEVQAS